MTAHM